MVKEFINPMHDDGNDRMRVRLTIVKGRLKNFVFQYETFLRQQWHPVIRYDLAHGFFHQDILKPRGEKEQIIIEIETLSEAAIFAEKDIQNNWQFYKLR